MVSQERFLFDILVAGECPHDVLLDSTPQVERPGGAMYSAIVARALGARVAILGDTGDDAYGKSALSLLAKWGIDCRGLEVLRGPTPTYRILNCDEIVPQVATSLFNRFRPARSDAVPADYASSRALLIYPYDSGLLLPLSTDVKAAGGVVYFDLQHDIRSLDEWAELLARTDVVFASSSEILHITAQPDLPAAVKAIHAYGPQLVVVKLGLAGSIAFSSEGTLTEIPCFQSDFKCTVGAGDAYNAAFVISELANRGTATSGMHASLAASLFVEQLTPDDIYNRLSSSPLDREGNRREAVFVPPDRANRTRIYVAGHFLSAPSRAWVNKITAALETRGFRVSSPHRDVGMLSQRSTESDRRRVFEEDLRHLNDCHAMVALLDGAGRGGTSWEIGYAFARGIPVLGLLTDSSHPHSNMIFQSCKAMVTTPGQMLNQLYSMISSGEIPAR
jgi:sugar/nucleoside kinase (ribokinase family)/nucleoside 2-deoxyribosyltransferase